MIFPVDACEYERKSQCEDEVGVDRDTSELIRYDTLGELFIVASPSERTQREREKEREKERVGDIELSRRISRGISSSAFQQQQPRAIANGRSFQKEARVKLAA